MSITKRRPRKAGKTTRHVIKGLSQLNSGLREIGKVLGRQFPELKYLPAWQLVKLKESEKTLRHLLDSAWSEPPGARKYLAEVRRQRRQRHQTHPQPLPTKLDMTRALQQAKARLEAALRQLPWPPQSRLIGLDDNSVIVT